MKRTGTILVAIAVVIALAAIPLGATAAITGHGGDAPTTNAQPADADDANDSVEPGAQLAGVIGVQDAELDGEVSERTYGLKIASAATNESKADVVGDQLADVEERLENHEATLEELAEAREDGEISEGEYRAKIATVAAESATTERMAGHAGATAGDLPAELLEERGIDVVAIEELRTNASELGGPETAEIARSIAGDNVGQSIVADREPGAPIDVPAGNETPADGADDDRAGNQTDGVADELGQAEIEIDRAAERIDQAEDHIDDEDDDARDTLDEALEMLNESEAAFDRAQDAADEDADDALEHANDAIDRAEAALELADDAIDRADDPSNESDSGTDSQGTGQ